MNLEFTQPVRCYDGAFDSASQKVIDAQNAALVKIRTVEPEAHVTYHPEGGDVVVHVWGRLLSGYHKSRGSALSDALRRLGLD